MVGISVFYIENPFEFINYVRRDTYVVITFLWEAIYHWTMQFIIFILTFFFQYHCVAAVRMYSQTKKSLYEYTFLNKKLLLFNKQIY